MRHFFIATFYINEDRIGRKGLEAARLFEREEALHPPVAFEAGGPVGAFAPQHPNAPENKSVPFNVMPRLADSKYTRRRPLSGPRHCSKLPMAGQISANSCRDTKKHPVDEPRSCLVRRLIDADHVFLVLSHDTREAER